MQKNLNDKIIKAVKKWCRANKIKLTSEPRHIHPRAYVIGHVAPSCIAVAVSWADSEPQCVEYDKANPLRTLSLFDESLKAGDWCSTAYICRQGAQQNIAIPVVV